MPKVLITGGNKGIGFATTTCFLHHGYHIVIVARDFSAFPCHAPHVQQVRFDLRHYREIPRLVNEVGAIDILVNNAGILPALPADHYPEDTIDDILAVNLRAPVALIQAFAPGMVQRQSGRIVNVASHCGAHRASGHLVWDHKGRSHQRHQKLCQAPQPTRHSGQLCGARARRRDGDVSGHS